jgi:hypothetical protein
MMTEKDIEIAEMMAKAWKMNDERNRRLAEEAEKTKKVVDPR